MAITGPFNVQAATNGATDGTSLSADINISAGTDRGLIACIGCDNRNSGVLSTVVFNGSESLTQLGFIEHSGLKSRNEIWYLANPTVAAAAIVLTWSQIVRGGAVIVSQWDGVEQTSALMTGGVGAVASSGSTLTVDVTSATGDQVIDTVWDYKGTGAGTVGSGQTALSNQNCGGKGWHSTSYEGGAATVTMNWTNLNQRPGNIFGMFAGNIVAASGGGGAARRVFIT